MKYVLSFCLVILACPILLAAEFPTLTGTMSDVRIIEIARLRPGHLKGKEPAKDGLLFVFRIDRLHGHPGYFTLSELRDFTIDGGKYRKPDNIDPSTLVEPLTVGDTWTNFIAEYRPDLSTYQNTRADADSEMMIVEIYGPQLPARGDCKVVIDVGWGKETEKFSHSFRLGDLRQAVTELKK